MALGYTTSGGEKIQSRLPDEKVVRAFNIIAAAFMVDGKYGNKKLDMFIAGNAVEATKVVTNFLTAFNWNTHDLDGLEPAWILAVDFKGQSGHQKLEAAGFDVWRDQTRLETNWSRDIALALAETDAVCLI